MPSSEKDDPSRIADPLARLIAIMARLRDPDGGCPWDIEQTFRTIAPYTIEEAYEVADAIEREDMADLKEELGDLLLQVVYHARMAEEAGHFDVAAVAGSIADKMVRRHPHVFGTAQVGSAEAQTRHWEDLKAEERRGNGGQDAGNVSVLSGVPQGLPALMRAEKLQKRAARVGFDWPEVASVFDKISEEITEIKTEIEVGGKRERLEDEVGDLLFAVANLARHLGADPETALRRANWKFERRFAQVENAFEHNLTDTSLDDMERAWQDAKKNE